MITDWPKSSNEAYIILWHGQDEYCVHDGPLEEVIDYVKADRRYHDYGRNGATIVAARRLWEVQVGPVERTF